VLFSSHAKGKSRAWSPEMERALLAHYWIQAEAELHPDGQRGGATLDTLLRRAQDDDVQYERPVAPASKPWVYHKPFVPPVSPHGANYHCARLPDPNAWR
jgi:hypothetical protein